MKGFRTLTKRLKIDLGQKRSRRGDLSERRVYGAREKCFLSREKWKGEVWIAPQLYIENAARWIKVSVEICQALNLNRNESVEVLSRICQWQNSPQWIENLSRSYQANRMIRNMAWWIEEAVENLSRICLEAIELE